MKFRTPGESLSVDTVVNVFAVPSAITEIDETLVDISAASGHEHSAGIFRAFRDDVDYTVDSICSPNGAAWSPDDFNAFDILQQCVLDLPINAGKERRVNAPAIDKHEDRAGQGAPKSANTEGPSIRVDPRYLNTRRLTESLRNACSPGPPDIVLGNNVDCGRSSAGLHGFFGGCCDLNLPEIF